MMYATTLTAPVFGLRREIDRLFEHTLGQGQGGRNEWSPAVDVYETNQELTFAVELAGIKPENVEVTAIDGILTIQGERIAEQREGEEGRYHVVERNYGTSDLAGGLSAAGTAAFSVAESGTRPSTRSHQAPLTINSTYSGSGSPLYNYADTLSVLITP
jgi:hypothetical protein